MSRLHCTHCEGTVKAGETVCAHCGMPLPKNFANRRLNRFKIFFIIVALLCIFMMLWLPPDWSHLIGQ